MATAGVAISVVALLLAVAAVTLATVANRRLIRMRPQAPGTPGPHALADLRDHLELLAAQQRSLAQEVQSLAQMQDERSDALLDLATRHDDLAAQQQELVARQQDEEGAISALAATAGAVNATALRRVAIVRYDAFADVGGRLSHSTAILDDTGSGLVITSLSGKADIRTYVKAVSASSGESPLTPEEEQAVTAAMGDPGSDLGGSPR